MIISEELCRACIYKNHHALSFNIIITLFYAKLSDPTNRNITWIPLKNTHISRIFIGIRLYEFPYW